MRRRKAEPFAGLLKDFKASTIIEVRRWSRLIRPRNRFEVPEDIDDFKNRLAIEDVEPGEVGPPRPVEGLQAPALMLSGPDLAHGA